MAEYGNNFSNNSGDYSFTTTGHALSDSDWVVVDKPEFSYVDVKKTSDTDNNVTTYGSNYTVTYNQTKITDSLHVAYFNFPENRNTQGSISGEFSCYVGGSKTSKYYNEPTKIDDPSNGVSVDGETLYPYRHALTFVGTTDTRGYRKSSVGITPIVKFNLLSYDNGTDGYSTVTFTQYRNYARQTFLNEVDPKGLFHMEVTNHDDANSTSPTFATVSNATTYYGVNFSYAYNPYNNSAKYQYTTTLDFTYNKLPLYPKNLVMTYDSKYNNISYDGDKVNVEAKAWYNGSYDRFTTSTATDDGFTTYKRYCDITYSFKTFNSSTTPTATSGSFRLWQPASTLGISYTWSIDGNPSWAHLSNTSTNKTTVTLDDQGDYKGEVHGKLKVNGTLTMEAEGSTSNTVDGVTWKAQDNKSTRYCTVRNTMDITNCIAQNVTPKNSSGMPTNTFTIKQNPAVWQNPSFNMKFKLTCSKNEQVDTPYISSYYPTVTIDGISASDGNDNHTVTWNYATSSKSMSIKMIKMSTPWVNSYMRGTVKTTQDKTTLPNSGGTVTLTATPDLYANPGYYKGYSDREWTLSNTEISNNVAQVNDLQKFDTVTIHMNKKDSFSYTTPTTTVKWAFSNNTTFNMPSVSLSSYYTYLYAENKQGENQHISAAKSVSLNVGTNYKTAGIWSASGSQSDGYLSTNGTVSLKVNTTSVNKDNKYVTPSCSISTTNTGEPTLISYLEKITVTGDWWNGTITFTGSGDGFVGFGDNNSSSGSITYPANTYGTATGSTSCKIKGCEQRYVDGAGTLGVSITSPSDNISVSGQTLSCSSTGSVSTESEASKTHYYSIDATSTVVSTNPSGGNPVISGSIIPKTPSYHYEYKLNSGSWTKSSSLSVSSNSGSVTQNSSATLTADTSKTDVSVGIYNYSPGHYHRNSTSSKTHNVYIRVVDDNNSSHVYEGSSASKTQSGDSGSDYGRTGSWTIYPSAKYHCSVSPTSIDYNGGYSSESGIGSFSVTPSCSTPSGNVGTSSTPSTYIWNYSDTRGYSDVTSTCSVVFVGDGTFNFNASESIHHVFGVNYSTPDSTTRTGTGSLTWNYMYGYKVKYDGESSTHDTDSQVATGDVGTYSSITLYRYYRVDGGSWTRLNNSTANRTLEKKGKYSVEVAWRTSADSSGDDTAKSGGSASVTINQYDWKYSLTVSGGGTIERTAFDTTDYSMTVTYTSQKSDDGGDKWTDSTPTFSWSGATSTTNTATVTIGSVSEGSSGSTYGSKTVTCTVKNGDQTKTVTWTLRHYGKSYYNS